MAVITVSRQFGAGGRTLGEKLAKRLQYRLVDEDILDMVAEKAKVTPGGVLSFERSAGSMLMKFLDSMVSRKFIDRLISEQRGYIDHERYVELVREIVLQLHKDGNVVLIGRGGQYILGGHADCVHILLVADRKFRERFLMDKYNVSEKVAEQAINREDRQRHLFLNCFKDEDHDHPLMYDLVINTGRVSMEKATDLVVQLLP